MNKSNAGGAPSTSALFITEIRVDRLFGQYSYDLKPEATMDALSRLLILYGENGSGKTTLLWLVFHLLSREPSKGHRTFLAKSRFRRLAVVLGDGSELVAERQSPNLTGSFEMSYTFRSQRHSFHYRVNGSGVVPNLDDDQLHSAFTQILPDLNMKFLADDRKISTDLDLESEDDKPLTVYWDESLLHASGTRHLKSAIAQQMRRPSVQRWETALDRVVQWVREQAIRASNQGQLDFNAIYADIVRRVGRATSRKVPKQKTEDLVTMLTGQAQRNHEYAKFGLTSDLRVTDLLHSISKVDRTRLTVINQILRPYVEGNEARLRALASLQRSIQTFVDSINDFYVNKLITFDVREGFKIYAGNEVLHPSALSSGEKQLLILFCNILSSSDKATIFIIDEPELSLNVSWQRKLLDAMVKCVGENQVQFFFATHSLELVARHMNKMAKLVNTLSPSQTSPPPVSGIAAGATEA